MDYVVEYCIEGGDCEQTERIDRKAHNLSEEGQAGATYTWTVEAFDAQGNTSGKSEERRFTITAAPAPPAEGCDCDVSPSSPANPWSALVLGLGVLFLGMGRGRRRRR